LHTLAQEKLALYLSRLYPRDCAVSEVSGVLGGRNDLMLFAFDGHRVVFEFFFSPSQVPQDLRLLEQAKADVKIAILLDREANPKLADEYFHKKPGHFPFLWLSYLMVPSQEEFCLALLRELVDEHFPKNLVLSVLLAKEPELQPSAGMSVLGTYTLAGPGASMNRAVSMISQQIRSMSNGSTCVSFSLDTAERSTSSEVAGNITVQY